MSGKPSGCICTETPFFSVSPRVNDLDHYLAFPPGERCEARPERTQGLFILAPSTIASEAEVDRVGQEIRSTGIPRGLPAE